MFIKPRAIRFAHSFAAGYPSQFRKAYNFYALIFYDTSCARFFFIKASLTHVNQPPLLINLIGVHATLQYTHNKQCHTQRTCNFVSECRLAVALLQAFVCSLVSRTFTGTQSGKGTRLACNIDVQPCEVKEGRNGSTQHKCQDYGHACPYTSTGSSIYTQKLISNQNLNDC